MVIVGVHSVMVPKQAEDSAIALVTMNQVTLYLRMPQGQAEVFAGVGVGEVPIAAAMVAVIVSTRASGQGVVEGCSSRSPSPQNRKQIASRRRQPGCKARFKRFKLVSIN